MAYKHYTSCFLYPSGGKPYNEKDRTAFVVKQILLALGIAGVHTLVGLIAAGPPGAIIGGIFGSLVGFTNLIDNAAGQWLEHRLICLNKDNPQCAVGIVSYDPTRSDLGAFDNDQYFDVVLMPHPTVNDTNVEADFDEAASALDHGEVLPRPVDVNRSSADRQERVVKSSHLPPLAGMAGNNHGDVFAAGKGLELVVHSIQHVAAIFVAIDELDRRLEDRVVEIGDGPGDRDTLVERLTLRIDHRAQR